MMSSNKNFIKMSMNNETIIVNDKEGQPPTFDDLERFVYEKFAVKDTGVVRLICAAIIAHKINSDPVWIFLVAPPSGLKTELIRALDGIEGIHGLSSLTPHTLISGQKKTGKETSLLLKIQNGIFTFKDFTSVLEMNKIARDEILSQLREIYDGQYSKSFGTGDDVRWDGKIGFLAGVTEAVDLFQGMYNILGERFLQYRIIQPERKEATRRGMQNAPHIHEIRQQMKELFANYMTNFKIPEELPAIPEDWIDEIVELSNFATLARSAVMRDANMRDITHIFAPEMPIRFAKQLTLLAQTFLIMGVTDRDKNIIRKIAFSSLSKNRLRAFLYLSKSRNDIKLAGKNIVDDEKDGDVNASESIDRESEWTSKSIGIAMGLPTTTARRILEEINAQGFVERSKLGSADAWMLKEEYKEFFRKYYSNEFFAIDIEKHNFPEMDTGISQSF